MLQLTWIPEALALLPFVYLGGFALLLACALYFPQQRFGKALAAICVLALFCYNFRNASKTAHERELERRAESLQNKASLDAALALFNERCKSAGRRVRKTADNVDGIVWMRWRPDVGNRYDQFALDDPYGHDCGGDGCILELLRVTRDAQLNPEGAKRHQGQYEFIESADPTDGKRYRYTAAMKLRGSWTLDSVERFRAREGKDPSRDIYWAALEREPITAFTARYGLHWVDISTREDRLHWIAGSSLQVLDLVSGEVIAERIGYMVDPQQGSRSAGRQPWSYARDHACPSLVDSAGNPTRIGHTRRFAESILHVTPGK